MQDKFTALMDLSKLQLEVGSLFVRAEAIKQHNDYEAASAAYHEYIQASHALLEATLEFNEQFPESPFGLLEIVQPLINARMVCADIESSLGKRKASEVLRVEAISLSHKYLDRKGTAESHRARAASLALEGRFNEAIVALMEARDVMLEVDDKIALARIAIDLADVLHWLGDFQRAEEEIDHASAIIEPIIGDQPMTQSDVLHGVFESISSIMSGKGDPGAATRNVQLYRAYVEITYYRGLIAKALHKWDKAEDCFQKVLPEYRSLGTGEAIVYGLGHGRSRDR